MLEQSGRRPAQTAGISYLDSSRLQQPLSNFRLVEMEDQVVRPQTGDITVRVEAFEGIVEVVGQEDFFQVRQPKHLILPAGLCHEEFGAVAEPAAVGEGDVFALKVEESASDL